MRDEPRLIKLLRAYQVSLCNEIMVLNLYKDLLMILYAGFFEIRYHLRSHIHSHVILKQRIICDTNSR